MTDYKLTVSVRHQGIMPVLDVVQGDSGRNIIMTVADMDITGNRARVYVVKPSGLDVYNEAVISNGTVIVELTAQMLAECGNTKMQISIYKSNTIERVSTFAIYLNVEKSFQDTGYINSSTEYKTLDSLIEQAQGVVDEGTAKLDAWMLEKDQYYSTWTAEKQTEYDGWTSEKQQAFLQWQESFKTANTDDFNTWYEQFKTAAETDFIEWFTNLQNMLDENQAANLANKIDTHELATVRDTEGVHGVRLSGRKFQVNIGAGWATVASIPTGMTVEYFNVLNLTVNQFNVKNWTVEEFNNQITLEVM